MAGMGWGLGQDVPQAQVSGGGWSWLSHGVCVDQHRSECRDSCHGPACPAGYMRNPLWPAVWGPLTQIPVWTGSFEWP